MSDCTPRERILTTLEHREPDYKQIYSAKRKMERGVLSDFATRRLDYSRGIKRSGRL